MRLRLLALEEVGDVWRRAGRTSVERRWRRLLVLILLRWRLLVGKGRCRIITGRPVALRPSGRLRPR